MSVPAFRQPSVLPGTLAPDALRAVLPPLHEVPGLSAIQAFDEAGVQALARGLSAAGSDLLVLSWPGPDHALSARDLCAFEAARRSAIAVALIDRPQGGVPPLGADDRSLPGAVYLPGDRLNDAWPALWTAAGLRTPDQPEAAEPAVSVVVRSMDRPTLSAALRSISSQTWSDLEVIVVNAAGPGHRDIASVTDDRRVRIVAAADGAALPRARAANVGLQATRGRCLMFLDDDDLLLPDHLAKLLDRLQRKPELVAAYGDVDFGHAGDEGWQSHLTFASDFDPVRLSYENFLPIHAVLFRRQCLEGGLQFDEQLQLLEDWDFWLGCAAQGPFERVPGVSARYHAGTDGSSDVFVASDLASRSLAHVLTKWQQRLPAAHWVGIVERLLQAQRLELHAQRRLAASLEERDSLRAVLQARDVEIGNLRQRVDALSVQSQRESAPPMEPGPLASWSRALARRWSKPR